MAPSGLVDRLALMPPEAVRLVGEQLKKLGEQRERLRASLQESDRLTSQIDGLLIALAEGRRLLIPTADPAKRARILSRATERILAELEASSPEAVRAQLKALVRQITVEADGRVVVEGTYEPLVLEGLTRTDPGVQGSGEKVRAIGVPGART